MRIAFTADAHLGQTQYGLPFRALDYEQAFKDIMSSAVAFEADAAILGGDIFHTVRPPVSAVVAAQRAINFLGRPVYSIDGNHDNTDGRWMHLCGATPLGIEVWPTYIKGKDGETCRVIGIDGGSTQTILEKLALLRDRKLKADLLVLHLPLAEMAGFPTQVSAKDIASFLEGSEIQLVLLGDIHDGREAVAGGIRFVYSGSPDMTAADEDPSKSYLLVDFANKSFNVTRMPIHIRQQSFLEVKSEADLENLRPQLTEGPLYHISFDGKVMNAKQRIMTVAAEKNAYVVCTAIHTEREIPKGVDRSGFKASFAELVSEDFADDKEAGDLLLQTVEAPPESVMEPAKKFLNKKGIRTTVRP